MAQECEVLIVGAGIIGLSIARALSDQGVRDILIVERGKAGKEASWAAAGMLSPNVETAIGTPFHDLARRSLESYPAFSRSLLDETGIDVELDGAGTLLLAFDESRNDGLRKENELLNDAGVSAKLLSKEDVLRAEPNLSSDVAGGLSVPSDWQVDNRKLLDALLISFLDRGGKLIEDTEVSSLIIESGRVAGANSIGGEMRASRTILATGCWTSLIKFGEAMSPLNITPVRGQMIWWQTERKLLERVVYGPDCYLVPRRDGRIICGSTSENVGYEKGNTKEAVDHLMNAAHLVLPELKAFDIAGAWSGLRPRPEDELPIIGTFPELTDLVVATGHYRNGILLAPITAEMVANRDFLPEFSPGRSSATRGAAVV